MTRGSPHPERRISRGAANSKGRGKRSPATGGSPRRPAPAAPSPLRLAVPPGPGAGPVETAEAPGWWPRSVGEYGARLLPGGRRSIYRGERRAEGRAARPLGAAAGGPRCQLRCHAAVALATGPAAEGCAGPVQPPLNLPPPSVPGFPLRPSRHPGLQHPAPAELRRRPNTARFPVPHLRHRSFSLMPLSPLKV